MAQDTSTWSAYEIAKALCREGRELVSYSERGDCRIDDGDWEAVLALENGQRFRVTVTEIHDSRA
jgi:hypothetical protein